jgi:predicted nucleotidyltransferase component of viral defense system
MFHLSTVERNTLQTLEEIFVLPEIGQHFALAGGTSLALQIGHRMSVDLDIFSEKPFSTDELNQELKVRFQGDYEMIGLKRSMLFTNIKRVKCDFIHEPARTIRPHNLMQGIRLYSIEDVCAMKMHTICGRGKKKVFFDIYALLQLFSWEEMLVWFGEKYGDTQFYYLWRNIQYFEDAEDDPDIIGFQQFNITWEQIKEEVSRKCV